MCTDRCCTLLEILIAILVPPLGVFLRHGCCSLEFCICLLLTFLGYVPGIIYAVYVIVAVDPETYQYRQGYWQPINGPAASPRGIRGRAYGHGRAQNCTKISG